MAKAVKKAWLQQPSFFSVKAFHYRKAEKGQAEKQKRDRLFMC